MSTPPRLAGIKVMVIDDSNTIRKSAEIFLKQAGAEVILAEDGFDALAKINDSQPHIIFCDILASMVIRPAPSSRRMPNTAVPR